MKIKRILSHQHPRLPQIKRRAGLSAESLDVLRLFAVLIVFLFQAPAMTYAQQEAVDKAEVIKKNARQALEEAKKKVVDEAAKGLELTYQALSQLGENKIEDAKSTLTQVSEAFDKTGRGKDGFITTAIFLDTQIGVETPQQAENLWAGAKEAMAQNNPQLAREMLAPLASEINISEVNIPVATYRDLIKKAMADLDAADKSKAEQNLLDALGSAVIVSEVLPVPTLLAEADLDEAAKMIKEDPQNTLQLLESADDQIALSAFLGYERTDAFDFPEQSRRKKVKSDYHAQTWKNIQDNLDLIKKSNAANKDKAVVAQVDEAVKKIEEKRPGA